MNQIVSSSNTSA